MRSVSNVRQRQNYLYCVGWGDKLYSLNVQRRCVFMIITRLIIVSEMTKSLHKHYRIFRERMTEEMDLKCFLKTDIDDADVTFSGRVFHSRAAGCSDWKSLIANGWKMGAWDNKRWCQCRCPAWNVQTQWPDHAMNQAVSSKPSNQQLRKPGWPKCCNETKE